MRKLSFYIVAGAILFTASGCAKVLQSMYGMKPYRVVDKQEIEQLAQKYQIPADRNYAIDTSYRSLLQNSREEFTSFVVENHLHPLQACYYNKNGVLTAFHTGVYADASLSNLRWNTNKNFNVFPPYTAAPADSMLNFQKHLNYVHTLDNQPLSAGDFIDADYNVIVHWAGFTGRQTKRLVKVVSKNAVLNKRYKVNYIYVNTDNLYENR